MPTRGMLIRGNDLNRYDFSAGSLTGELTGGQPAVLDCQTKKLRYPRPTRHRSTGPITHCTRREVV